MQKGTTLFYHKHISQNLQHLQKRKSNFIKHRKQFLSHLCTPIQDNIKKLDEQIDQYKHLIQNQNTMIQNQSDVVQLKKQIIEFQNTQKYFLSHLQQYQQKIIQNTYENELLQGQIKKIRSQMSVKLIGQTQKVYKHIKQANQKYSNLDKSNISFLSKNTTYSKKKQEKKDFLPTIFKVDKYYEHKQTSKMHETENSQKIIVKKFQNQQTAQNNQKHDLRKISQKKQIELKTKFKNFVSSFNKFELLYKQCYEKKKYHVQRSVSQLQSRLITNRQKFLQICQAIGQRSLSNISCQQFQQLTGDQIMTLLISFPWIQKKLFQQFLQRRKQIVDIQAKKMF